MAIQSGPDTYNEKALNRDWPFEEGTTAATTRQVGDKFLHPEGLNGVTSIISKKDQVGLNG